VSSSNANGKDESGAVSAPAGSAVILTPLYTTRLKDWECFGILRNARLFPDTPKVFFVPESLDTAPLRKAFPEFSVETFPSESFASIQSYSRLLLTPAFYERFARFEFMLIAQTDVFLFAPRLGAWVEKGYDYVGAPFYRDFGAHPSREMVGVGNGGLSLRRIAAMRRVLQEVAAPLRWLGAASRAYRHHLKAGTGEDIVFCQHLAPHLDFFRIAPIEEAIDFAYEMHLDQVLSRYKKGLPFGCHSRWNASTVYALTCENGNPEEDYQFWIREMLEANEFRIDPDLLEEWKAFRETSPLIRDGS
jgi:hypothetical protein